MKGKAGFKKKWEEVGEAEKEYTLKENLTYQEKLRIFEAMWEHAVRMGAIKLEVDEEELEQAIAHKIRMARIINGVPESPGRDSKDP